MHAPAGKLMNATKPPSNLLNEGTPALAKNLTLYYNNSSVWTLPRSQNNYTFVDYGNGAYFMSFVADIPSKNVRVSVDVHKKEKNIVVTLKSVK